MRCINAAALTGAHCAGTALRVQCRRGFARRELLPDAFEIGAQDGVGLVRRGRARNQQDVEVRQRLPVMPEAFADDAADTVADHGKLGHFARNRAAQTRRRKWRFAVFGDKTSRGEAIAALAQRREIGAGEQPRGARQAQIRDVGRRAANCGIASYGIRRLRPLARRAFNTARPPRVFMRARKPCVRACLRLPG